MKYGRTQNLIKAGTVSDLIEVFNLDVGSTTIYGTWFSNEKHRWLDQSRYLWIYITKDIHIYK